MSNIWKYKYLVDVIDHQSFTEAGSINFVSQTAISQNISALEKTIGGKLIHRGGSGKIVPTELGEIVYHRAKEMLELEELMLKEAQRLQNKTKIRVGVDSAINKKMWLLMERVYEAYFADKDIEFGKFDCRSAVKLFENHDLDIFVSYDSDCPNGLPGMISVPLGRQKVGVYVGKHTTIPYGTITLDDLKGHKFYYSEQYRCSVQKEAEKYLKKDCPILPQDNVETMNLKVEFNDGFAFVDSDYYPCSDGEIRELSGHEKECELRVYCPVASGKQEVEAFVKRLELAMRI